MELWQASTAGNGGRPLWRADILDNLGCYASVAGRLKETKVLRSAIDRDEEIRGLALRGRVAAFVTMDRKSAVNARV